MTVHHFDSHNVPAPETTGELKSLKIDAEMHRRLKIEAASRGVSIQQLTEAALALGLAAPALAQTLAGVKATGTGEAA